jgi:hypothetical protein
VSVRIPNDHVEDRRIQKLEYFHSGSGRRASEEFKAAFETWSAFGLVFLFRWNPESLAKVFLVKPSHFAGCLELPIVSCHQQVRLAASRSRVRFSDRKLKGGCQLHHQRLILGRRPEVVTVQGDGRFGSNDVGA